MDKFERVYYDEAQVRQSAIAISKQFPHLNMDVEAHVKMEMGTEVWGNGKYQVVVEKNVKVPGWPDMIHLSVKLLSKEPIHDWRDLQAIKNELLGPEYEAVELYPAESRLVDTANQFHLWALSEPGMKFPFGFTSRLTTSESVGNGKQRPF